MKREIGTLRTKICLLAVSVLLFILVFEVGLRVAGFNPFGNLTEGRKLILRPSDNPDLVFELTPGAEGYGWGTDVKVNSAGFRGPEVQAGKSDNFRIIVLGDSITFGNDLPAGTTYPPVLAEQLAEDGPGYEVLNFGVGGYNCWQEVAFLEQTGLAYHPDLVVVGFCLNDVKNNSPNLRYMRHSQSSLRKTLHVSRVYQFVETRLHKIEQKGISIWRDKVFAQAYKGKIDPIGDDEAELRDLMKAASSIYPAYYYQKEDRVGLLRYAFRRLKQLSDREDFRVVILMIPWLVTVDGQYPHAAVHEIVKYEADRCGFDVIDMQQAFLQHGMMALRQGDKPQDTVHPNERGHRMMATALHANVKQLDAKVQR